MRGKVLAHIGQKKKKDHIYYVNPDGYVIEKKMRRGKGRK